MRLQGIWKIVKNKHELGLIIITLSISFALLSAVSIVNETYQMQMFTEIMDESVVDFQISLDSGTDPTEKFDDNLGNYEGWLEIEYQFKSTIISIDNAITLLNYQSPTENISREWDFQDTYTEILFIGIDENTFNFLQNGTKVPITNMNNTYQQLEEIFIVSNFLGNYECLFSQLNMVISSNASSQADREMPVKIDLFNDKASNSTEFYPNKITKENASLSIHSTFQIINEKDFFSLVGIHYWQETAPIFLCGEKLLNQFANISSFDIYQIDERHSLNLKFDRLPILKHSPQSFSNELLKFQTSIQVWSENSWIFIEWGSWKSALDTLASNFSRFQIYSIMLFIPIFLLCGKYLKTSFSYLIEKRKNEFGLYLINGMQIRTLNRILLGIGLIIGIIGGLMGTILGLILSKGMGNALFPSTTTYGNYITSETWSILLQNGLTNSIAGGIFTVVSLYYPLKTLDNQELRENFIINPLLNKEDRSNNGIRNGLLIIFLVSLILIFIYDQTFEIIDYNILSDDYPLLFWALYIAGPLMGLFPFVFPTLLIAFIGEKLGDWIEKFQRRHVQVKSKQKLSPNDKISRHFQKKTKNTQSYVKKLTSWNIIHKLNKNTKLLEIYALAIIFITISVNISDSYEFSERIHSSLYHAEGKMMNMDIIDEVDLGQIQNFTNEMQQDASEYGFKSLNAISHTQMNRDRYTEEKMNWEVNMSSIAVSSLGYYCFSWVNYTLLLQDTAILEKWIIGGTPEAIFKKMLESNSILVPQYLLQEGVNIDETLQFEYTATNGSRIHKEGVVVGAYSKFPASYMERDSSESVDYEIYMSFDLLKDARIESVEIIYYADQEITDFQQNTISTYIYNSFSADFSLQFLDNSPYYDPYDAKTFELFQLEGILLIFFAIFGIIVYSMIDRLHSNAEMAILRAKGLLEKDLIKSIVYETLILVGVGSILSLLSIVGTKGLILYLNFQRTGSGIQYFHLYYSMNWNWFILISGIAGLLFFITIIGFSFFQVKSTRSDRKLEALMRTSY
ncbi:FtsX-like permease family protein [Candidatus Lokiarchaeum ossiferum]|uniref:FtsX-like permease family protein n=1 Tax=Candidatus Lokiarchaeum ossiferum TaxID=2951803 RepID=UPI00352F7FFE